MTDHQFETDKPVRLFVELGRGSVRVDATDTTTTRVQVTGRDAEHAHVRQDGDQITVVAPKQRGSLFGGESRLDIAITLPTRSEVVVRTGSADVDVSGQVGAGHLRTGSGDVRADLAEGPLVLETGSGDIWVGRVHGDLKAKSGSGDVTASHVSGATAASSGSGRVELGSTHGPVVVKTGSGDLRVGESRSDVSMTTGSGDLVIATAHRGRVTAKAASGDVHVGVPAGVPVWTDISTVTGAIRSNLQGAGQPAPGADHVEVRAKVVSGDVVLTEI